MLKIQQGREERFRVDLMIPRVMATDEVQRNSGWQVRKVKLILKPVYKRGEPSWGLLKSVNAVRNWFLQEVE